ncbi:MAG: hypothetical protein ACRDE7_00260 [Sphingobacterium sp.]
MEWKLTNEEIPESGVLVLAAAVLGAINVIDYSVVFVLNDKRLGLVWCDADGADYGLDFYTHWTYITEPNK